MKPFYSKWFFYLPITLSRGERITKRLRELQRTQWYSRDALEKLQQRRFTEIVNYAGKHTRYYEQTFRGHELDGDASNLPTLTKSDLVKHFDELKSDYKGLVDAKTTGGSTGRAVTVRKDRNALAWERAVTWRGYEWAGLPLASPQARFWGVPTSRKAQFVATLADLAANRKRFSAFSVDDSDLQGFYDAIHRFKPYFLYGYVSFLRKFATFLRQRDYRAPGSLRSVVCTSEVLDQHARQEMTETFSVPVFNEYGCGEVGSIAHECEQGSLHVNADTISVEIDSEQRGGAGELVVTDLLNRASPLIRYRLGDYGQWSEAVCPCGRGLPVLRAVFGRAYDAVVDPSGRWHHPEIIMYAFEDLKRRGANIDAFQVVQTEKERLEVFLVAAELEIENWKNAIIEALHDTVSKDMSISVARKASIPREASGKLRLVKREIDL